MSIQPREIHWITISILVLVPAFFFIAFWWPPAALLILNVLTFPEEYIALAALLGLSLGIAIALFNQQRWTADFYRFSWRSLILIYLAGAVIATALFMGLPVGLFSWGLLAAIYIGRRLAHTQPSPAQAQRITAITCRLIAATTGVFAFLIGLLAVREGILDPWLSLPLQLLTILFLAAFLAFLQYIFCLQSLRFAQNSLFAQPAME